MHQQYSPNTPLDDGILEISGWFLLISHLIPSAELFVSTTKKIYFQELEISVRLFK